VAAGETESVSVEADEVDDYLGARKFFSEVAERTEVPGVATGLAWTPVGGDILFIEASVSRGSGRATLTGKLGDVMRESAQAAHSWVKAHAEDLGVPLDAFNHWDVHVHVPAGAIPKDGPSAGVAMVSALASIYTQRRVRHDIAMTGEITLRGLVLPVGGIKEKVVAAARAGITRVMLPARNRKDCEDIPAEVRRAVELIWLENVDDAVTAGLGSAEARTSGERQRQVAANR
jgi:ATP-dependent Lon protease